MTATAASLAAACRRPARAPANRSLRALRDTSSRPRRGIRYSGPGCLLGDSSAVMGGTQKPEILGAPRAAQRIRLNVVDLQQMARSAAAPALGPGRCSGPDPATRCAAAPPPWSPVPRSRPGFPARVRSAATPRRPSARLPGRPGCSHPVPRAAAPAVRRPRASLPQRRPCSGHPAPRTSGPAPPRVPPLQRLPCAGRRYDVGRGGAWPRCRAAAAGCAAERRPPPYTTSASRLRRSVSRESAPTAGTAKADACRAPAAGSLAESQLFHRVVEQAPVAVPQMQPATADLPAVLDDPQVEAPLPVRQLLGAGRQLDRCEPYTATVAGCSLG